MSLTTLVVAGCLSLYHLSHGVDSCLSLTVGRHSLTPMVARSLSLSLKVVGSLSVSLPFHEVAACLSQSLKVADCLSLSLCSHGVAACLSMFPIIDGCLSQSLQVPWCHSMSFTVCHG